MRKVARGFVYVLGFAFSLNAAAASAQSAQDKPPAAGAKPPATIASKTEALKKLDGFMPLYWDEKEGKLLMEIGLFDTELLYQVSLPAGVGSNPIGLDRGALGDTHVVTFQRVGPKVLMVEPNYRYRAITSDPAELRAVKDSFAQSVLWGFTVEASEGSRVLVDATKLILRDAYGVIDTLRDTRQGQYRLDESRSALYLERTKNFPKNSEIEATLTFVTDASPGPLVRQVTPTPQAVTVRQHHSFIELPKLDANGSTGYKPRKLDPRVGAFGIEFHDYASPITEPIEKRWIVRHRLEKKDPAAAVSEAVKPIVYYVDNGAPEPIRSALVEGASWWAKSFEAAGFKNGFQVKVLPADADPMDVRYNVINWVHRSTRGWSYGNSIVDPRTGEILKGHVTLGSLRVRQDYMLGTGMIPTYTGGAAGLAAGGLNGACEAGFLPEVDYLAAATAAAVEQSNANSGNTRPNDPSYGMSIQRIRQLSAHEVGHTIGFAHNFAASTYGGRASVMDYPAPLVEIKNGALDLSNAYTNEIGAYDTWSVKFAYAQFAPGAGGAAADEAAQLEQIVQEGVKAGMAYITDQDARPAGASHPLASLWDNGSDPIAMLKHEMDVRRIGLSKFGLTNVPTGSPLSLLEAKLLPLYLHHRFQLQAAVKSVGGAAFSYAVRTASGPSPSQVQQIVPAATQRAALDAVLATITPEALDLPDGIIALIPPKAFGFGSVNTELFDGRTDPVFDPLGAASIAADMAISGLLQHQRAARLNAFHATNAENPAFADVLEALQKAVWGSPVPKTPRQQAIQRTVQHVFIQRLMDVASHESADPQVRAEATGMLRTFAATLNTPGSKFDRATNAHRVAIAEDITRFMNRPDATFKRVTPLPTPPGDPIGGR